MSIGKKKNFIMGGLFFLIVVSFLTLLFHNDFKDNIDVEKYTTKDYIANKELFAMYIENDDGEYTEYTDSNYFPLKHNLNLEKSFCVDKNEKKIENILSYKNSKVTVKSNKTVYCHLYFDQSEMICEADTPIGECINTAKTLGYNSSLEGGLYRYQGTSVNNYVCFGTIDKEECLADTDAHMYRVIGVDESGRVKVIKKEALNDTMQWYSNYTTNITWPQSTIYSNINGSSFLTNTTYMPNGWDNLILSYLWKYGDNTSVNVTADALYNTENAWANTTNAKIGLIYAHDYAYAYQSGGLNCLSSGSTCKTSWMYISVSDSGAPSAYEWTMSRYGLNGSSYFAWYIESDGAFNLSGLHVTYSVRPVFYLTSETLYSSGNGTLNSPFMLQIDEEPPTNNSVSINSGASSTSSTSVTLTLASTGATEMCISNTTSCSNWETYATSKSWTLTSGDGTKTVYALYRDEYGNTSEYVTDTITYDTTAPTVNSVKINSNATYTNSTSVTLTLASTGASEMCISNTTSCSNWQTYTTSKSWTLNNSTNGTKTVYVWYRDAAGNTTSSYVSDTITLDTVIPTVTASADLNNTAGANVKWSTSEDTTVCVNTSSTRTNVSNCLGGNINSPANNTWTTWGGTITASGTYYVHAQDAAGNIGISSGITLTKLQSFGEYLIANKPTGLNTTTVYGGLYRFIGNSANNYVKLGSVVYRVIGVTSAIDAQLELGKYQVKLIKSTSVTNRAWHSSDTTDTSWSNSSMYSYLQGSSVLGSTSVIPSGWSTYIDSVKWWVGAASTYATAAGAYAKETSTITSSTSKIALMYYSDYAWAYTAGGGTNCNSTACTSWLTPTAAEWMMSRYGYYTSSSAYYGWGAFTSGKASVASVTSSMAVRPVFYLVYGVRRTSGSGTSSDPFILSYS